MFAIPGHIFQSRETGLTRYSIPGLNIPRYVVWKSWYVYMKSTFKDHNLIDLNVTLMLYNECNSDKSVNNERE